MADHELMRYYGRRVNRWMKVQDALKDEEWLRVGGYANDAAIQRIANVVVMAIEAADEEGPPVTVSRRSDGVAES